MLDEKNHPTTAHQPPMLACNLTALSPLQRSRQKEVLSPALQSARVRCQELPDGYALAFASDAATLGNVFEWVSNEYRCCPFFVFDIHVSHTPAQLVLRITGVDGVKPFLKSELANLIE